MVHAAGYREKRAEFVKIPWGLVRQAAWKGVKSRPVLVGVILLFATLWIGEWRAFRMASKLRSAHYVTHDTIEATKWQRVALPCVGGPVEFIADLSDKEIRRLARERGLELVKRVPFAVPGGTREVPVFRDREGQEIRPLGEKEIEPAPWGGSLFAGLAPNGALWADMKPHPEPFNEKLSAWRLWVEGGYLGRELPGESLQGGLYAAGGLLYDWRRVGRWHIQPAASGQWSEAMGWEVRGGLRLSREQLPARWR